MYNFSKYKDQYRDNLRLALPVMMSQLGAIVVQVADNLMVGRYGGDDPLPLAAASFAGSFIFMPMVMAMGMTFGLTPIVGELFAQGRKRELSGYLHNGIILYTVMALLITVLLFAFIPLMWHLGQPDDVVEMAIPYYRLLSWSLLPMTLFFIFKQFLEGMGNTLVAMTCVIMCNIVNILLNHMLIGGEWGATEMGVRGAGVATLISRILMPILLVGLILTMSRFRGYLTSFSLRNLTRTICTKLVKLGFPISAQISLEVLAFVVIGFMFGWFDATAIGAFQVAVTVGNASFMIVIAIGSATTIRLSHCYGERDVTQMRLASTAAWHIALVWSVAVLIIFLLLRHQIVALFTTNEQIIELASVLLLMIATYQIPDGFQCIGVSIMRGMQDVKIIPVIALIAYWFCNMPIGYLCAFHLDMGPAGLYVGLIIGFIVASLLAYLRIRSQQTLMINGD